MKHIVNQEYTVKDSFEIEYEKLSSLVEVKHFLRGQDAFAVHVNHTSSKEGFHSALHRSHHQEIISESFLNALLKEPHKFDALRKQYSMENPILLVEKSFLPFVDTYGLNNSLPTSLKPGNKSLADFLAKDLLVDLKKSQYEFIQLCKSAQSPYLSYFVDTAGKKHIEPFLLDYTNGHLHNAKYHLDDLVEYLSKRDDVAFMTNHQHQYRAKLLRGPFSGGEKGINEIIENIPSYNASEEEGKTESILVVYYPQQEDMTKLLAWNPKRETRKEVYNIESLVVKDILQCDGFLKVPEPVVSPAPRRFKS